MQRYLLTTPWWLVLCAVGMRDDMSAKVLRNVAVGVSAIATLLGLKAIKVRSLTSITVTLMNSDGHVLIKG